MAYPEFDGFRCAQPILVMRIRLWSGRSEWNALPRMAHPRGRAAGDRIGPILSSLWEPCSVIVVSTFIGPGWFPEQPGSLHKAGVDEDDEESLQRITPPKERMGRRGALFFGNQSSSMRALSSARIAIFRRDRARRSYRSMADNCRAFSDRMVASFSDPFGVAVRYLCQIRTGICGALGCSNLQMTFSFFRVSARDSK